MRRPEIRIRCLHRGFAALLAATFALLPGAAAAHEPATAPVDPAAAGAALGRHVDRLADGLYLIRPGNGRPLTSHGPDAVPDQLPRLSRSAPERPPSCAGDNYQHLLVGHLAGLADPLAATAPDVRRNFRELNAILNQESLASGGPNAGFRVLCDPAGEIRVDSFAAVSPRFEDVVAGAREAGFERPDANYTIFFDAPAIGGWCGMASFAADERLVAGNRNNDGGAYAVAYRPCWESLAPLHEIAHNQGAVQAEAPNSTGSGGHCNQLLDIVCFAPDGGDRNQVASFACLDDARFDCGYDDYFDSAPEPGEYLASHWNLGSPLNRYIDFGLAGAVDDEPAAVCGKGRCAARLRLDSPTAGVLGPGSPVALYRVRVPKRSTDLRLSLKSASKLELRIRRGRPPGAQSRRCGTERCRVAAPKRGPWFVSVDAEAAGSAAEFEITAVVR